MIQHIAIVGHKRTIEMVKDVVNTYYKNIRVTDVELNITEDVASVVSILKKIEEKIDGVLFTGKIPYNLVNAAMFSHRPWVYIDQNAGQLQRTLLEGLVHHDYDITKASIDSYEKGIVYNAYQEIQLSKATLDLHISNHDIFNLNFLGDLVDFHRQNVREKGATFCLTGISSIYETLVEEGVPCLWLRPTIDTIKNTVERLELRKASQISAEREIVVVSIELDLADEYTLVNENEYQLRLQNNKLAEIVTLFAQKIQAAVVETSNQGFLLFSTRNILEQETELFKKIPLLEEVKRKVGATVSIGIGFGTTAREAKYHALKGMYRSRKYGGNQAYVVTDRTYIGPIHPVRDEQGSVEKAVLEEALVQIADQSGISLNTIFRLHCIASESNLNRFTPKELSELLGHSIRSTNRLLVKLESNGLIQTTGRQIVGTAGRPSRVFKILF